MSIFTLKGDIRPNDMQLLKHTPHDLHNISDHGFAIGVGSFRTGQIDLACTYRPDWQEEYFKNGWMKIDPVVKQGALQRGLSEWPDQSRQPSPVLDAARDFGLTGGLVLSNEIAGNICIGGISTPRQLSETTKIHALAKLREMHYAALAANAMLLSPEHKNLVYLFANGYRAKQVAHILDIAEDTIKQRKTAIRKAIGVENFLSAVNICSYAGITIHPTN